MFKAPGAAGVLAGLMARLALPMAGIGIITMLSQLRGAYALAGAVAATFSLSTALLAPWISRGWTATADPGAAAGGGLASWRWRGWRPARMATGRIGPCSSARRRRRHASMPAMVRARWSALYRDQPLLRTAFALESVLDEVTLIVGPPLAVG